MTESVISTMVPGELIQEFVDKKLQPIMIGERLDVAAAAMLWIILTNMMPDITAEQVATGISSVAGYMVTYLSGLNDTTPMVVN